MSTIFAVIKKGNKPSFPSNEINTKFNAALYKAEVSQGLSDFIGGGSIYFILNSFYTIEVESYSQTVCQCFYFMIS